MPERHRVGGRAAEVNRFSPIPTCRRGPDPSRGSSRFAQRRARRERGERHELGNDEKARRRLVAAVCCYPSLGLLCGLRGLCVEFRASTYINRRLWITFWRRFLGRFLGDFGEVTGLGGGAKAVFSLQVSCAGEKPVSDFGFFRVFGGFWCGFCRFLCPFSHSFHPCHVHTFMCITSRGRA